MNARFARSTMAVLVAMALPMSSAARAITVDELIRHIDTLWRGDTSHATMTMAVKTRRYEPVMTMETWSRGKNLSLVVIREPVKDRDVATAARRSTRSHRWPGPTRRSPGTGS